MWREFFPLDECRPQQEEALEFIFSCLDQADDIFLEAPTGIGKSAIAQTVGLYLEAHSKRTYVSTTTVDLENQYVEDFYDYGLRQLHSSVHYQCPHWTNCDIGSCTIVEKVEEEGEQDFSQSDGSTAPGCVVAHQVEQEKKVLVRRRCPKSNCPYEIAKEEFEMAAVSIANSAYLITKARFVKEFPARSLLIVDEAHKFHDQITSNYAFVIQHSEIAREPIPDFPAEGEEIAWLTNIYWPFLEYQIGSAKARFFSLGPQHPEIERARNKVRALLSKKANLKIVVTTNPGEWIFDVVAGERFSILPVWASRFAPGLMRRMGAKRIFMSATLPDLGRQARWLGIDPENGRCKFLSLPSPFPEENRLIYCHPVVHWDWKNPQPSYDTAARELLRILDRHPTQRGLVHVSSYKQAEEIVARCNSPRLLTHTDSAARADVLKRVFATPGLVLVSPSSREGLDFFGDRSEFQVVLKLPYASLGDRRVKRRMADDHGWYGLTTAQQLVQAAGRSVRSMTDVAATYILDRSRHFPGRFQEITRSCSTSRRVRKSRSSTLSWKIWK